MTNAKFLFALLIVFFLGFFADRLIFPQIKNEPAACNSNKTNQDNTSDFSESRQNLQNSLTNPLLDCDIGQNRINNQLLPFKNIVEKAVNEKINQKQATTISVYFRDLNNGPWFGINQDVSFTPASLLKLPLMMAYFKISEDKPEILKKQLLYKSDDKENLIPQDITAEKTLEDGKSYSVEELIRNMIIFSDNRSLLTLYNDIDKDAYDKIYTDLAIKIPDVRTPDDYMSVKEYGSFFRMLFNASYLNRNLSEKALDLLIKVKYDKALRAGVPDSVKVAHKFGERQLDGTDVKQLHDCGIVYFPNRPYLLCIMTRGNDFDTQAAVIKEISKLVYDEVDKQF